MAKGRLQTHKECGKLLEEVKTCKRGTNSMDCLYIVIPAYNEQDTVEEVIRQWHPLVEKVGGDSRLVVLNDGSTDATKVRLRACKERYSRLVAIHKENQGHGATVLAGYRYAIAHGADYIFQTDSDGQTLPGEFWPLWKDRHKCGLLLGRRRHRQDGLSRIFVTKVLRLVLFGCFGVWLADANAPFRLMRAEELKKVLRKVPRNFYLSNVLISVIYKKYRLGVYEYPITFRPRQGGENSINLRKICGIGWQALRDFLKIQRGLFSGKKRAKYRKGTADINGNKDA